MIVKINYSVHPLYLFVNHESGYIEEKGDFTDENKELLKKYKDIWNGIKSKYVVAIVIMKKVT